VQARRGQRLVECGPVRTFAALDLGEIVDNLPAAAVEIRGDRRALRIQPSPDLPCLTVLTR